MGSANLTALSGAHHLEDNSTGQVTPSGILHIHSHARGSSPSSTVSAAGLGREGRPDELVAGLGVSVLTTTGCIVVLDRGTDGFVGRAQCKGVAGENDELNGNKSRRLGDQLEIVGGAASSVGGKVEVGAVVETLECHINGTLIAGGPLTASSGVIITGTHRVEVTGAMLAGIGLPIPGTLLITLTVSLNAVSILADSVAVTSAIPVASGVVDTVQLVKAGTAIVDTFISGGKPHAELVQVAHGLNGVEATLTGAISSVKAATGIRLTDGLISEAAELLGAVVRSIVPFAISVTHTDSEVVVVGTEAADGIAGEGDEVLDVAGGVGSTARGIIDVIGRAVTLTAVGGNPAIPHTLGVSTARGGVEVGVGASQLAGRDGGEGGVPRELTGFILLTGGSIATNVVATTVAAAQHGIPTATASVDGNGGVFAEGLGLVAGGAGFITLAVVPVAVLVLGVGAEFSSCVVTGDTFTLDSYILTRGNGSAGSLVVLGKAKAGHTDGVPPWPLTSLVRDTGLVVPVHTCADGAGVGSDVPETVGVTSTVELVLISTGNLLTLWIGDRSCGINGPATHGLNGASSLGLNGAVSHAALGGDTIVIPYTCGVGKAFNLVG